MTMPPGPPATVGTQPRTADEMNMLVGQHLRRFTEIKGIINQDAAFLVATDLKAAPYYFSTDQETLIKSAVSGLDTSLDDVDMTFIVRLIGM